MIDPGLGNRSESSLNGCVDTSVGSPMIVVDAGNAMEHVRLKVLPLMGE